MITTYSVLNSIAAAAADFSLSAQNFSITGAPVIRYGNITSTGGFLRSLAATRNRYSVAFTAANNTTYKFLVQQVVDGVYKQALISYISDASGTEAEIIGAFEDQLTAHNFDLTVTGATSPFVLTSTSDNPTFTVTGVENVTPTVAMDKCYGAGGAASVTATYLPNTFAIAGTTTVTVTSTAHGLSVGMQVTWAVGNGAGTINGATSGTFRVGTVVDADNFTLSDAIGAGGLNDGTTSSLTLVAQDARGTVALLTEAGVDSTLLTSGNTYTSLTIDFVEEAAAAQGAGARSTARRHTVYFNDTDSDFADLYADIVLKLKGYTTGTTPNVAAFNQIPI